MKLGRVWAVVRKESIHVLRDPRSIGMGIAIPMIMIFLFGYALTLDVDDVPLIVWDQSDSHSSREYLQKFLGSPYFKFQSAARNYPDVVRAIDTRQALAGLIIPRNFAEKLETGKTARVQWIVDGSDSNTASIATGYAERINESFSQNLILDQLPRTTAVPASPLDMRARVWFNADLESKNYIIPGLIAVIMMVIASLLTSLTIAREWETGTMEQLISTPVQGLELIFGKLVPYFGIGMFDVFLAVLMGEFLFQVPLRGDVGLIFGLTAIFLVGVLSMGLLISIVTKKQLLANQLALMATFIPAFVLSGFAFPIENMPTPIQWITYLVPARYLVSILKGIYLKGVGLDVLYLEVLLLSLFSLAMFTLAVAKFRKKLG